eukprot:COSAG02_NODE_8594_length_2510_cov_4.564201_1_plen_370_part_00
MQRPNELEEDEPSAGGQDEVEQVPSVHTCTRHESTVVAQEGVPPHRTEPQNHDNREEGVKPAATQRDCGGLKSAPAEAAPAADSDEQEEDLFAPVPDEAVALLCSFLGVRELGRIACVARRFTERVLSEPDVVDKVSAIEQGAILRARRLLVGTGREFTRSERQSDETWLRMLCRVEHGPRFVPCPFGLFALAESGALATRISGHADGSSAPGSPGYPAVLTGAVMSSGKHVAEMELVSLKGWKGSVFFGVTRPECRDDPEFAAYKTEGNCFYQGSGFRWCGGGGSSNRGVCGSKLGGPLNQGGVVRLLLEFSDATSGNATGTLSVYIKGQRGGVVLASDLKPPLVWACLQSEIGGIVRILCPVPAVAT